MQGEEPCAAGTGPEPLCSSLGRMEASCGMDGLQDAANPLPKKQCPPAGLCSERGGRRTVPACPGLLVPGQGGRLVAPCAQCRQSRGAGLAVRGRQDQSLSSFLRARGSGLQSPARDHHQKKPPVAASHVCNRERSLGIPRLCGIPCHCHPVPAGCCAPRSQPTCPAGTRCPRERRGWVRWWHQEVLGVRCAWPGLGRPSCLPQPCHALILPRPASTATVRVISSKSLCASPLISSRELGLARPAERLLFEGTFAVALPPGTSPYRCRRPATGTVHGPCPCPKQSAVEARGDESARLGREVGEPCQSTGLRAGACQAQMGLLVVVKIIQPLLKTQAQQPDPAGSGGGNSHWSSVGVRFPCHCRLSLGRDVGPQPSFTCHHVPTAWSPLLCWGVGSLLPPALGNGHPDPAPIPAPVPPVLGESRPRRHPHPV